MLSRSEPEEGSRGEQLLADIRAFFAERPTTDQFTGAELANWLTDLDDRPWAESGPTGKAITATGVARILGRFGIRPRKHRVDSRKTARLYDRHDFADAFGRYLSAPQVEQPPQNGDR
jgi:hypothetical protein